MTNNQRGCRIGPSRISWAMDRRKPKAHAHPGDADHGRSGDPLSLSDHTHQSVELTMPSVLICPYLLRRATGRFRDILTEAGFDPIDPEGGPALSREELLPYLPRIDAMIAGGERMTPELFALAPRLRAIAR